MLNGNFGKGDLIGAQVGEDYLVVSGLRLGWRRQHRLGSSGLHLQHKLKSRWASGAASRERMCTWDCQSVVKLGQFRSTPPWISIKTARPVTLRLSTHALATSKPVVYSSSPLEARHTVRTCTGAVAGSYSAKDDYHCPSIESLWYFLSPPRSRPRALEAHCTLRPQVMVKWETCALFLPGSSRVEDELSGSSESARLWIFDSAAQLLQVASYSEATCRVVPVWVFME